MRYCLPICVITFMFKCCLTQGIGSHLFLCLVDPAIPVVHAFLTVDRTFHLEIMGHAMHCFYCCLRHLQGGLTFSLPFQRMFMFIQGVFFFSLGLYFHSGHNCILVLYVRMQVAKLVPLTICLLVLKHIHLSGNVSCGIHIFNESDLFMIQNLIARKAQGEH